MCEKITVAKEVAKALEELERNYIPTGMTLNFHATKGLTGKYAPLQMLAIEDLAKALLIGYEVVMSPEEEVHVYFLSLKLREDYCEASGEGGSQHRQGWLSVIETLNILGIKIEGVNT